MPPRAPRFQPQACNPHLQGYDFEVMARLHAEGMISNPHNRNASVHLTPEGLTRAKALADAWFGASSPAH